MLEEIRKEIDAVDEILIKALEKRFTLVQKIQPYKPSLEDPQREASILKKTNCKHVKDIYQSIFKRSKEISRFGFD